MYGVCYHPYLCSVELCVDTIGCCWWWWRDDNLLWRRRPFSYSSIIFCCNQRPYHPLISLYRTCYARNYETFDYNFHNIRALTNETFKFTFLNNGFLNKGFIVSPPNIRDMFRDMNVLPFGFLFGLAHGLAEPEFFIWKYLSKYSQFSIELSNFKAKYAAFWGI